MRRRIVAVLLTMVLLLSCMPIVANALVVAFGTAGAGTGSNPFNPRGYYVALTTGEKFWISSKFETPLNSKTYDELGHQLVYTGQESGLDYVDAELIDSLYTQTDRNPTPGYKFLIGYSKDSISGKLTRISNFSDYIEIPSRTTGIIDPNGQAGVWTIKINMEFEPGTVYEFAYLRGMQANNGITCVIAENKSGYIRTPISEEEQVLYDKYKNDEYEYLTSATKDENGEWQLEFVPMRYRIQTYADISEWISASENAQQFLDGVTPEDIANEKYKQENIDNLKYVIDSGNAEMDAVVKKMLQKEANASVEEWTTKLSDALYKAQHDIPVDADLAEFNKVLKEAKALYNNTKDNVGTRPGQYGSVQVNNLKSEITTAESTITIDSEQSDVDDTVNRLNQAMLAVKTSRVTEDEMRFYDPSTGIAVIVPKAALPENAKLYVGEYAKGATDYDKISDKLDFETTGMVLYKIAFFVGNKEVKPTETVEVQIPVVSSLDANSTSVFLIDDDYNSRYINGSLILGTHVFNSNVMGLYAVIEYDANNGDKNNAADDSDEILDKENSKDNDQQEMNEMLEHQTQDKEKPDNEPEDEDERNTLMDYNIDLSMLGKDFESGDLVYVGIGVAVFGLLMGIVEYIRGKNDNDMFV